VIIVSETIRRTRQQRCQPGIRAEVHVHPCAPPGRRDMEPLA
jgi:hypothetical protein